MFQTSLGGGAAPTKIGGHKSAQAAASENHGNFVTNDNRI
jgi:hypothetical protein